MRRSLSASSISPSSSYADLPVYSSHILTPSAYISSEGVATHILVGYYHDGKNLVFAPKTVLNDRNIFRRLLERFNSLVGLVQW